MARFAWRQNLDAIRAMLADGKAGVDVARHFGLKPDALYTGLRFHGLTIDPKATLAAKRAGSEKSRLPAAIALRSKKQKARMADPAQREIVRQATLARHRADPELRQRMLERSQTPEALAARKAACQRVWDARLAWCPPQFRVEYHRLIRSKRMTAREAKAALLPDIARWLVSFEGQLWRVGTGQARLVDNVKINRPAAYVASATCAAMT